MAIFDVPQRFSRKWVADKVPGMDSTEFHAMFHEAATRGWSEDELRQLARMWAADGKDAQLKRVSAAPDGSSKLLASACGPPSPRSRRAAVLARPVPRPAWTV